MVNRKAQPTEPRLPRLSKARQGATRGDNASRRRGGPGERWGGTRGGRGPATGARTRMPAPGCSLDGPPGASPASRPGRGASGRRRPAARRASHRERRRAGRPAGAQGPGPATRRAQLPARRRQPPAPSALPPRSQQNVRPFALSPGGQVGGAGGGGIVGGGARLGHTPLAGGQSVYGPRLLRFFFTPHGGSGGSGGSLKPVWGAPRGRRSGRALACVRTGSPRVGGKTSPTSPTSPIDTHPHRSTERARAEGGGRAGGGVEGQKPQGKGAESTEQNFCAVSLCRPLSGLLAGPRGGGPAGSPSSSSAPARSTKSTGGGRGELLFVRRGLARHAAPARTPAAPSSQPARKQRAPCPPRFAACHGMSRPGVLWRAGASRERVLPWRSLVSGEASRACVTLRFFGVRRPRACVCYLELVGGREAPRAGARCLHVAPLTRALASGARGRTRWTFMFLQVSPRRRSPTTAGFQGPGAEGRRPRRPCESSR